MSIVDILRNTSSYYDGDVYGGLECLNYHSWLVDGIEDWQDEPMFAIVMYTDLCQSG